LDRADSWIPRRMRGERLHHGGDVCGIVCWWSTVLTLLFLAWESHGMGVFVPAGTLKL